MFLCMCWPIRNIKSVENQNCVWDRVRLLYSSCANIMHCYYTSMGTSFLHQCQALNYVQLEAKIFSTHAQVETFTDSTRRTGVRKDVCVSVWDLYVNRFALLLQKDGS